MSIEPGIQEKIAKYIAHARQAVATGRLVLAHEDYITTVNRAYYAIFYAANALLASKGLERSKHSAVIAAFRQHFVKTGLIEPEFSRFFGAAMDERHAGDYDLTPLDYESASRHLENAAIFLERMERALQEAGIRYD
ncbi:MAG: HEPN domain-containing protein [Anaerolineae bacterium]|nr:HEPN domain-containing protein [Anaerolineae bacterium]